MCRPVEGVRGGVLAEAGTTMSVCGSASAADRGGGPALAGRAIRESPLRWGTGIAPTTGSRRCVEGGDAPLRAPLDTGFRRYDDGGLGVGEGWWLWGEGPALAGRAIRESPLRRGLGVSRMRRGFVVGVPRPSGFLPSQECRARKAPFECPQDRLRQAQGERIREAPLRRWVGLRRAQGERDCELPLRRGALRQAQGERRRAIRELPLRCRRQMAGARCFGRG